MKANQTSAVEFRNIHVDALNRAQEKLFIGQKQLQHHRAGELLAEDLEALWEADETEGGARMMIGPSLHYRTAGRLEANVAGGPIFLLRGTRGGSDALRALGNRSVK